MVFQRIAHLHSALVRVPLRPSSSSDLFPSCSAWPAGGASPNHIPSRRIHAIKRSLLAPMFPPLPLNPTSALCHTRKRGEGQKVTGRICAGMPMPQPADERRDETHFPPAPHRVVVACFGPHSRRAWAPGRLPCLLLKTLVDLELRMERQGQTHLGCAVHVVALPPCACILIPDGRHRRTSLPGDWTGRAGPAPGRAQAEPILDTADPI